jgi:cell division protein FtsL
VRRGSSAVTDANKDSDHFKEEEEEEELILIERKFYKLSFVKKIFISRMTTLLFLFLILILIQLIDCADFPGKI